MPSLTHSAVFYSRKLRSLRERCRSRLRLEELECRVVPSIFTPGQIRHAYGFDQIAFTANGKSVAGDGSGQTIAIVDAFDAPTIAADLHTFNQQFGIPDSTFQKVSPTGTLPSADAGWAQETSLDVEWAHAIAPGANILLVEAASASLQDLTSAVSFAAKQTGVVAVSMSWGGSEFSGQQLYDSVFTTPAGHNGVTFVASSGDSGAWYGASWPASSPNVLSVGGTSLRLNSSGNYSSETGWSGSGGGLSQVESEPSYQQVAQNTGVRTTPDLSIVGNPNTGLYMYDSYPAGQGGWFQVGGTSVGAPQVAAMVAIADQGLALAGKTSLDGPSQTLPYIYGLAGTSYSTYFHDVTSGYNGYLAGRGYDLVTGLGSPKANALVAGLVSAATSTTTASATKTTTTTTPTTTTASHKGRHATPVDVTSNPGQGTTPVGIGSGQQTPGNPSSSSQNAASPIVVVITISAPVASASGLAAVTNPVQPSVAVTDPRAIPLATPAPSVTNLRVESGGGNNPLNASNPDQQADSDNSDQDMLIGPDMSVNAPRMAPSRIPNAAGEPSSEAWRQASDACFAADDWHNEESAATPGNAIADGGAMDSMAAFIGLGVVLGSYWGAPLPQEEKRRKREPFTD